MTLAAPHHDYADYDELLEDYAAARPDLVALLSLLAAGLGAMRRRALL